MSQTKERSLKEVAINIVIGYTINYAANIIIFPAFGYNLSWHDNLWIGLIFTAISLIRQYTIRRWFSKGD